MSHDIFKLEETLQFCNQFYDGNIFVNLNHTLPFHIYIAVLLIYSQKIYIFKENLFELLV